MQATGTEPQLLRLRQPSLTLEHIPKAKATTMAETPELKRIAENTKLQSNIKYHAEFEKAKGKFTQVADDPETLRIKQNSKIIRSKNMLPHTQSPGLKPRTPKIGRLKLSQRDDSTGFNCSNAVYHGEKEKKAAMEQKRAISGENGDGDGSSDVTSPPSRRVGSIADLDPVNDFYGSLTTDYKPSSGGYNNHAPPVHKQQHAMGRVYKALYDYDAQDSDEVSFIDGDLIVNCTPIDEGWMTGLVQRTGQSGMLPANYVEPAN
uniref:SH3 domain-containing protein n=1 Tax=Timema bartmani TaxID=61472 RepID=A0A7R9ESK4_9NEOP|nr:unnamed protein product [Timema bartmani]